MECEEPTGLRAESFTPNSQFDLQSGTVSLGSRSFLLHQYLLPHPHAAAEGKLLEHESDMYVAPSFGSRASPLSAHQ